MFSKRIIFCSSIILLSGCAQPQFSGGPIAPSGPANITPFSRVSYAGTGLASGNNYYGYYTRLVINHDKLDEHGQIFENAPQYVDRGPVERYLVGQEFTMNLTVTVTAGDFTATVPLVSFDHKSNRDVGEQWVRSVFDNYEAYPFFVVDSESATPTIDSVVRGSAEYSSQVATDALQVAVSVAKEVSPQSAAVTALSKSALKSRATAIDTAVNKLFGTGISEDRKEAKDIVDWRWNSSFKIEFFMPYYSNTFETDTASPVEVGEWQIAFDDPRPSLFSDWRVCDQSKAGDSSAESKCALKMEDAINNVYAEIKPSTVLDFQLVNADKKIGLISQYIAQQSWYTTSIKNLSKSPPAKSAVGDFCKQIAKTIKNVGLDEVDAGIVVWAFIYGQENLPDASTFTGNADCSDRIQVILNQKTSAPKS